MLHYSNTRSRDEPPGGCHHKGYPFETHLENKSDETSFIHNIHCSCPIVLVASSMIGCQLDETRVSSASAASGDLRSGAPHTIYYLLLLLLLLLLWWPNCIIVVFGPTLLCIFCTVICWKWKYLPAYLLTHLRNILTIGQLRDKSWANNIWRDLCLDGFRKAILCCNSPWKTCICLLQWSRSSRGSRIQVNTLRSTQNDRHFPRRHF